MACHNNSTIPKDSNDIPGGPRTNKSRVLEAGASAIQDFTPVKQICAHLNAYHVYASDLTRCIEANHYCSHITEGESIDLLQCRVKQDQIPLIRAVYNVFNWKTEYTYFLDVRQCLIYDSTKPNARLIGVEYMISPRLFDTLPPEERKLWHTHEYEVKSGMLIMPTPPGVPDAIWNRAETAEMHDITPLYGKTYHFWQVDRGDPVPLGPPELMISFVSDDTVKVAHPQGVKGLLNDRDERFGVSYEKKAEERREVKPAYKHPDADAPWKEAGVYL